LSNAAAAAATADDDDDADADYIRADQSSSSENDYSRCSTFLFLTFHKIFPISKNIYFFCFSLAFKRPIFHPASRQMSNQGTQILCILPFTNLRLKKNFSRVATHAADNNQIRTRDPRLKPSAPDAAHIW
jgi:hypothetical protein